MNMKKTAASIIITAMVVMMVFTGAAAAKSLYVIADINAHPTPIQAYSIQGNTLAYQATYNVPRHGGGAVGLTIDTDSETLFVTYEASNVIEKIDAKTMTSVGSTTVTGASNLAGIVVDQDKGLVYAVDRGTRNLYIYNLSLVYQSTKVLPTGSGSYGIALDEVNDLLYVADRSTTVRYYETTNWTEQGNFAVTPVVMGIAVDVQRGYVYSGGWSSTTLSKYDLNTDTESTIDCGSNAQPIGFAVDPATGLLYVTMYHNDTLRVYDLNLVQTFMTSDIGNPTGVCVPGKEVGYNPLNLSKSDDVAKGDCVNTGNTITYTICYDSVSNQYDVHNVTIVDTLPVNVSFVSAAGNYDSVNHIVTWNIGTVPAGTSVACVTLIVRVKAGAENTTLTNCAEINGDEVGPTQSCEKTDVCTGPTPIYPPGYEPVPTLAPIGMILLIGLMLVAGFVTMRRKG